MPAYNVENYIERCLKSLISQTLDNIEIIVVNDGSTDGTEEIINRYKSTYPNLITTVSTNNNGLSEARNLGISLCSGEYVAFVDSDDYVEPEMFEKMYRLAREKQLDVVACAYKEVYESFSVTRDPYVFTTQDGGVDLKKSIFYILPVVWNKIYKREFFDYGFKFSSGINFEDIDFTYRILPFITSVGVVKEPLYNYIQRENSISHTYNKENLIHVVNVWNDLFLYYKQLGLFEGLKNELEYSYFRYVYNMFDRMSYDEKSQSYDIFAENIRNNVRCGNKYICGFMPGYQIWGRLSEKTYE